MLQEGPLYPSGHEHTNLKLLAKHEPPLIQGFTSHGPEAGTATGSDVVTDNGVVLGIGVLGRVVAG